MENLTPAHAMMIVLLAFTAMGISVAYQCRDSVAAFVRRYVDFRVTLPAAGDNGAERRPHAVEQAGDEPEQGRRNMFQDHVAAVSKMTDDQRLALLALLTDDDGEWLYAETRVARFIGGRVEDRQSQIRAIRGEDAPPPEPGRVIPHRVNGEVRSLALD